MRSMRCIPHHVAGRISWARALAILRAMNQMRGDGVRPAGMLDSSAPAAAMGIWAFGMICSSHENQLVPSSLPPQFVRSCGFADVGIDRIPVVCGIVEAGSAEAHDLSGIWVGGDE